MMKKFLTAVLFFSALLFFGAGFVAASTLDDAGKQGDWALTHYDGTGNPVDSAIATHAMAPMHAGVFQFSMHHNKSGLFYFYALTSDMGGQLLFSIQFTESKGVLLEEGGKQITLLEDYTEDQPYLFTIDFDNSRGKRGTFKVSIDGEHFGEYDYVDSESAMFDLGQMVFGSESNGAAVSEFSDVALPSAISKITTPLDESAEASVTTSDIDGKNVVTVPENEPTASVPEKPVDVAEAPVIVPQPAALQEALPEISAPIIKNQPVESVLEESITVPSVEENPQESEIITAPF